MIDFAGLWHGFQIAVTPDQPHLGADRLRPRHGGGRPAGAGPGGHDRAAAAHQHEDGLARHRHHPDVGHLLRRHVRRVDDLHPAEDPRGGGVGRHLHRRLRDGEERPRRRGPRGGRDRLLRRRHHRPGGPDHDGAAAGGGRAQVRPTRVLLAHRARAAAGDVPHRGIGAQGPDHGDPGPDPGLHRARPALRRGPLRLRRRQPAEQPRLRDPGDGTVRGRGDPLQPREERGRDDPDHEDQERVPDAGRPRAQPAGRWCAGA